MRHCIQTISLIALLLAESPVGAREVAGVAVADQAELADTPLVLNGAGIRSKFVFDIYIGALYLPGRSHDAASILKQQGPKRVLMHFLYGGIEKDDLTRGWQSGFEENLSAAEFAAIKTRLQAFNELFEPVEEGDEVLLDYLPGRGTRVTINQRVKGTIEGADFYQALLKVWLGNEPADSDLKHAMLGNS